MNSCVKIKIGNTYRVSNDFLYKLQILNQNYAKKKLSISSYVKKLQDLFAIDRIVPITEKYKQFLGGFILGEGSLNASIKKKQVQLGVAIDLEFSVTQNFYSVSHLINCISVFHTGCIYYKTGSNSTFVYKITNRKAIFEKVFGFWDKYIFPYQTSFEAQRYKNFKKFEELFNRKVHTNEKEFCKLMLPLWDSLRQQKQLNQTFESLEEAVFFVKENSLLKNKNKILRDFT